MLTPEQVIDGGVAISGGDYPVGRNSLTAGQLDAYSRVTLIRLIVGNLLNLGGYLRLGAIG
jgi:hypothetical protein